MAVRNAPTTANRNLSCRDMLMWCTGECYFTHVHTGDLENAAKAHSTRTSSSYAIFARAIRSDYQSYLLRKQHAFLRSRNSTNLRTCASGTGAAVNAPTVFRHTWYSRRSTQALLRCAPFELQTASRQDHGQEQSLEDHDTLFLTPEPEVP